ncbi:MAG TPA: hypothetical protein VJ851_12870 [Jatrophihabitans sp.]|nr:hypothetical protein [Jatrophihabitans sp.]
MTFDQLPAAVAINAWRGSATTGELDEYANRWGSRAGLPHSQQPLAMGEEVDERDWGSDQVGYGVLLPESTWSAADKAKGLDAPEAVRQLLDARPKTVMLRWDEKLPGNLIRRYLPDGSSQAPTIGLSTYGTNKGSLPRYILIIGGPDVVPWSVQYALETRHAVGRLPLDEAGLEHYIDAMLTGWPNADLDVTAPLMWTVSLAGDITADMRAVIANPLEAAFADDPRVAGFTHLTDQHATAAELIRMLSASHPLLVITSSHGLTLGEGVVLRNSLGLPVDLDHQHVDLDALDHAMPGGTIWYSQACCSAGGDASSHYEGLLAPDTMALSAVQAVAQLGPTVAPAATRLIGRANPVRAVLGHVEPTFDWTLRVGDTGQGLGGFIVEALSRNLFVTRDPIGYALRDYRAGVGELHTQYAALLDDLNKGKVEVRDKLTRLRLSAIDRQSLVLLGDPTVTLATPTGD